MSAHLNRLLQQSLWTHCLTAAELARVRADIRQQLVPAGGFVCRNGEPVDHWHGVADGLVKISNVTSEGRTTSYQGLRAGGWFGEGSVLKTEPRRYDVVALRDTVVGCLPRNTFSWLFEHSLPFAHVLVKLLNERVAHIMTTLEQDRLLDPCTRVARTLAAFFNPILYAESDRCVKVSQEELGHLAGVSRQRVNRALHELQELGILRSDYGVVTVLDVRRLACFEPLAGRQAEGNVQNVSTRFDALQLVPR